MSTDTMLRLQRPTSGVEVELVVVALPVGMKDPHRGIEGLPPVTRIPRAILSFAEECEFYNKVKAVLSEYFDGPQKDTSFFIASVSQPVLDDYKTWDVTFDITVSKRLDVYKYISVELSSPVQFASPRAFDAISYAISVITSKFRCIVNRSCGLHVHAGLGAERLPLEHIRRTASLSYAVESLLFTLHDPIRRVNSSCKPVRDFSILAEGTSLVMPHCDPLREFTVVTADGITHCHQHLGRGRRHGEAPHSAREENAD
jgi:hypothetical protein